MTEGDNEGFQTPIQKDPTRICKEGYKNRYTNEIIEEYNERKISELCRRCPFEDCDGCYQRNASNACETMKRWRRGELSDREASEIMRESGVDGAILFFHPFRFSDTTKEFFKDFDLESKDVWKILRREGMLSSDEILKVSPHFHTLSVGYLKNSKDVEENTGWVYRNMGRLKYNLKNRVKYNLEHAGVILDDDDGSSKVNTYVYIGGLK